MTNDTILDAAVKVFAKKGFEQTSVDDIAAAAKVAKGTLYYHFDSKDAILVNLVERGIEDFTSNLKHNLAAENDPEKKLEIVIETQLDYFYKYRDFCRILLGEIWRFEIKWKKHIKQIQEKYITTIENILKDGVKRKEFNADLNIEATTIAIFSMISLASLDWAIFHSKQLKREMLETIKIIFFQGIGK